MAALFLLLAVLGAIVVGDLVLENTAAGAITVLNHPISGYSDGLLLAMAAVLGFVVGLLVVGSASTRRTRRAHRKQLRTAERELSGQLIELERENTSCAKLWLAGISLRAAWSRSPRPPTLDRPLRPRPGSRSHLRQSTAGWSQSTRRSGGSLASVANPTCRSCRLMTRPRPSWA